MLLVTKITIVISATHCVRSSDCGHVGETNHCQTGAGDTKQCYWYVNTVLVPYAWRCVLQYWLAPEPKPTNISYMVFIRKDDIILH